MKKKIGIAVAALTLAAVFFGCGQQIEASGASESTKALFEMELVHKDGRFKVYQDSETGVQYILYEDYGIGGVSWSGIVPRYNPDGTLYTGSEHD